jgi:glutamate-5-semialdehyde dehydrogenase
VASVELRSLDHSAKDKALTALAEALVERRGEVLEANALDLLASRNAGTSDDALQRLALTEPQVESLAYGLQTLAKLPDPVGEVVRSSRQRNGIELNQVRVPVGVIAVLYEGQPSMVVRAVGSLLKTGNAALLFDTHGTATHSETALARILRDALAAMGLPPDAVQLITGERRASLRHLVRVSSGVDLVVPLLTHGVPPQMLTESTVPIVTIGTGNCHIYVDAAADVRVAERVVLDSKIGYSTMSHAVETLLVHADIAATLLPGLCSALRKSAVPIHADERFGMWALDYAAATEGDWRTEYRSLDLTCAVVDSLDDAIEHIARYGTGHTESVVTESMEVARRFVARVDAATVTVNAPTTFAHASANLIDPELAFSTQRLRPRGPLGLSELTTTKWIAWPVGQPFEHL